LVADRPLGPQAVVRFRLEVARPKAERDPAPMVGPPADHACAPPAEAVAMSNGVRLTRELPSADAAVEFAEGLGGSGSAAARRFVGPLEHRGVGRVVPRCAGLEHGDVETGAGEDVSRHSTAGTRADDADVRG